MQLFPHKNSGLRFRDDLRAICREARRAAWFEVLVMRDAVVDLLRGERR